MPENSYNWKYSTNCFHESANSGQVAGVRVLFNWETGLEVGSSKQNTVLFGEQRRNVAYFLKVPRGWNGTSLVLVYCFCKVNCRNDATRVVI